MGGNIFQNVSPIPRVFIESTLEFFYEDLVILFPGVSQYFKQIITLGSTGLKEVSGDIDLGLSESSFDNIGAWGFRQSYIDELFEKFKKRARTASSVQIMKKAMIVAIVDKINQSVDDMKADSSGSSGGSLFICYPQYDKVYGKTDKFVQVDINIGKLDWLAFSYYSSSLDGNLRGLHRTQLMLSLFSVKGYTFSHNYGVKHKITQEIVANTPAEAIESLNKLYDFDITETILQDYRKIQEFIRDNLSFEELSLVYDVYLKILDSTRVDIPDDLQEYWIANLERLGLTGKFLPSESELLQYQKV